MRQFNVLFACGHKERRQQRRTPGRNLVTHEALLEIGAFIGQANGQAGFLDVLVNELGRDQCDYHIHDADQQHGAE